MKKLTDMIDLGGVTYHVDFGVLDKLISTDESLKAQNVTETELKEYFDSNGKIVSSDKITKTYPKSKEIDGAIYDCIGLMLQIIMNTDAEIDETLGVDRGFSAMPLNWKIAFNTLTNYGVLVAIEVEEE